MGISQHFFRFYNSFPTFFNGFVIIMLTIAIKRCACGMQKKSCCRPRTLLHRRDVSQGAERLLASLGREVAGVSLTEGARRAITILIYDYQNEQNQTFSARALLHRLRRSLLPEEALQAKASKSTASSGVFSFRASRRAV